MHFIPICDAFSVASTPPVSVAVGVTGTEGTAALLVSVLEFSAGVLVVVVVVVLENRLIQIQTCLFKNTCTKWYRFEFKNLLKPLLTTVQAK